MHVTQALTYAVQTRPRAIATIDLDGEYNWAETGNRVARAASLLNSCGIARGDRVAILALNATAYVELLFAIPWAGAAIVPLNTRWAEAELLQAMADCGANILVADENFVGVAQKLRAAMTSLQLIFIGRSAAPAGFIHYETALTGFDPLPDQYRAGNDLWAIFYTGGTTGHPKGVMLSHTNIMTAGMAWIPSLNFSSESKYLHVVGFFHIAGAQPAIALTMTGGAHVSIPKFEPALAMQAIDRYHVNYCLFVPTMLNMLLNHDDFGKYDLSHVKYCEYGGAPMPDAIISLALEKLPTWTFIQGYGQTEASGLVANLPWKDHFGEGKANKRMSAGRAAYGIEMLVVDDTGTEAPRGTPGEIAVRGPTVMLGYWNNRQATDSVIKDGWLYTGDGAWMDDDGFIYVVDRIKDMIVSGGENVYSKEVENVIYTHPAVLHCAVIGIPHPKWGESVHAVIVLKPGMQTTDTAIIEHCRTSIAGFKCPRSIEFRTELPMSAASKVMKGSLRDAYRI